MKYHVWTSDYNESYAQITKLPPELNDNLWKLHKGISCSDWFPENVTFELSPNSGIKLTDFIPNVLHFILVSDKLKSILEGASGQFEYFPIELLNARGKKVSKPYFLANLVGTLDCLDKQNSEFEMSSMDKSQVLCFKKLMLDKEKLDDKLNIFRLAEMTQLHIVTRDLAVEIKRNNDCEGAIFVFTDNYR